MQKKRFSMNGFAVPAIALCSFVLSGNPANGALVNYSLEGSVSFLSGASLSPMMKVSAPSTGSFQFENPTSSAGGDYPQPIAETTVIIGGDTPSFAIGGNAVASPIGILTVNDDIPLRFDLQLYRKRLLNTTDLQHPPASSSLMATMWLVFENSAENFIRVPAALASLRTVPLPAAVLLFGAALISMVGFGAGGLRNLHGTQY